MLMTGYTKLFGSIVASTIWREDDKTRLVWITMLAIANKHGEVEASVPGLADLSRVSVAECRESLAKLESPDPDSRSSEQEGRRIEKVEGGWRLINHAKYRAKLSVDERREYLAQKKREERARQHGVNSCQQMSTSVAGSQLASTQSTHTEAEADTDTEAKEDTDSDSNAKTNPPPKPPAVKGGGDRLPTSETAKRIATIFKRRHTTAWSDKEIAAFKALGEIDLDDLTLLERYYASPAPYLRHDLGTFLNNFAGEIDRAKKLPPEKQAQAAHQAPLGKWGV